MLHELINIMLLLKIIFREALSSHNHQVDVNVAENHPLSLDCPFFRSELCDTAVMINHFHFDNFTIPFFSFHPTGHANTWSSIFHRLLSSRVFLDGTNNACYREALARRALIILAFSSHFPRRIHSLSLWLPHRYTHTRTHTHTLLLLLLLPLLELFLLPPKSTSNTLTRDNSSQFKPS